MFRSETLSPRQRFDWVGAFVPKKVGQAAGCEIPSIFCFGAQMLACLAPMLGGLLTASGVEHSAISCDGEPAAFELISVSA